MWNDIFIGYMSYTYLADKMLSYMVLSRSSKQDLRSVHTFKPIQLPNSLVDAVQDSLNDDVTVHDNSHLIHNQCPMIISLVRDPKGFSSASSNQLCTVILLYNSQYRFSSGPSYLQNPHDPTLANLTGTMIWTQSDTSILHTILKNANQPSKRSTSRPIACMKRLTLPRL